MLPGGQHGRLVSRFCQLQWPLRQRLSRLLVSFYQLAESLADVNWMGIVKLHSNLLQIYRFTKMRQAAELVDNLGRVHLSKFWCRTVKFSNGIWSYTPYMPYAKSLSLTGGTANFDTLSNTVVWVSQFCECFALLGAFNWKWNCRVLDSFDDDLFNILSWINIFRIFIWFCWLQKAWSYKNYQSSQSHYIARPAQWIQPF